jgi:hypothetical protein
MSLQVYATGAAELSHKRKPNTEHNMMIIVPYYMKAVLGTGDGIIVHGIF